MNEAFDTPAIPDVIVPQTLSDYFEVMTRAVFQAGVTWAQIAKHWNAYRRAFESFDVKRVADFDSYDIERVFEEPGILRMRRKIDATVKNARALLELESDFGTFHNYVSSFDSYPKIVKDMKKRFTFMGDMNVWYLLFRVGEPVPRFESWLETIPGDHPRMREMVDLARSAGKSSETTE